MKGTTLIKPGTDRLVDESGFHVKIDADREFHSSPRIGLLAPYGGTNLGDGVIQSEAIKGIRRQMPTAELWGITLNPIETSQRHGIPAFPSTGLLVPFYSETLFEPINGLNVKFRTNASLAEEVTKKEMARGSTSNIRRMKQCLKDTPFLGYMLRLMVGYLRKVFVVIHEIRHLGTSYEFVKKLDMVMVSGSGQLDETWGGAWGHPYVLFRWAILAKITGTQFVVVSVGVEKVRTILCKFFVRTALSLSSYRSYRDTVSKKLLKKWALTKDDPCVPDLAFGLHIPIKENLSLPRDRRPIVGISPMAFGRQRSWPKPAIAAYNRYLFCLAEFTALLTARGFQVMLFKSSGTDLVAIEDLQSMILKSGRVGVLDNITAPIVETVDDLIQEIQKVDFVIASRLHGVILSHILGKPVLAISYDRKVGTHMHDVEQGNYVLDFNNVTSAELESHFTALISREEEVRRIVIDHIMSYRNPLEKQYTHVMKLLERAGKTIGTKRSIYGE